MGVGVVEFEIADFVKDLHLHPASEHTKRYLKPFIAYLRWPGVYHIPLDVDYPVFLENQNIMLEEITSPLDASGCKLSYFLNSQALIQ